MANPYEVVYIFDSALEEQAINERLDRFHSLVRVDGAEAPIVDHWGKRTLAYPVRGKETGYYVVARFLAEPTALPEFEIPYALIGGVAVGSAAFLVFVLGMLARTRRRVVVRPLPQPVLRPVTATNRPGKAARATLYCQRL